MDVRAKLRQIGEGGDQIVAVADRVRGGETHSLDAINRADGFQQLNEWGNAVVLRKFMAAVEVDDLTEKRDLLHAAIREGSDFVGDFLNRAALQRLEHAGEGALVEELRSLLEKHEANIKNH